LERRIVSTTLLGFQSEVASKPDEIAALRELPEGQAGAISS
jgi:hypothetical protein